MARKGFVFGKGRDEPPKPQLPHIMMMEDLSTERVHQIRQLMEECAELKAKLDEKVDDTMYDPQFHSARRYKEVKEQLGEIQAEEGLEGIRMDDLEFRAAMREGRKTLDKDKFKEELLSRGVNISVILAAMNAATTTGEAYWVREIKVKGER